MIPVAWASRPLSSRVAGILPALKQPVAAGDTFTNALCLIPYAFSFNLSTYLLL